MRAAFVRQIRSSWVRDNREHWGLPWRGGPIVDAVRRDGPDGSGIDWAEGEVEHPDHSCGHVLISRQKFYDLTGHWPAVGATEGHWNWA